MATFTANFPELMETRQKDILFKQFTMQPQKFRSLFRVRPSTKSHEDRMRVAGLGTLQVKPEGTPVAFSDPVEGTRRRVVHTTYALGYRNTKEAVDDDQWNILDQMPADLGDSARDHQERIAWDVLNDGFAGNRHTTVDNNALFASARTGLKGDLNESNVLAPALALSVGGLEAVMDQAKTTRSEEGRYIQLDHAILVIHPNNSHNAHVLLNTQFRPGSSDNDVSTVVTTRSQIGTVLEVPFLTSTTQWSVHATPGRNGLTWNNRQDPTTSSHTDAVTFDMLSMLAYRASVQINDWRNNFGSQGTA